jgi:hypothetical protein
VSNSLAIAAVTATIRNLLFAGVNADVPGTTVGTGPPDRVRTNGQDNRLNLFLYHTSLDPAWRNQPLPGVSKDGEDGRPPLPLSLYYLVTAYGENDDGIVSHRLLGKAMSVLHDHPVLDGAEIKAAVGAANIAESDLDQQIERVRITPQPLTLEEMSKLWTTFQTQYRISAAYQACVVLIESTVPARAPVPVLTRGDDKDTGPVAQGSVPSFPTIEGVVPPPGQPSAVLGDEVRLAGHDLGATTSLRVTHLRLGTSTTIAPGAVSDEEIRFHLPGEPTDLPAGLSSVSGVRLVNGEQRFTNEAPLEVAPTVVQATAVRDLQGVLEITVTCSPRVFGGQNVQLLLSEHQIPLGPVVVAVNELSTDTLVFTTSRIDPGDYLLRLRVDGADSILVDRTQTPPVFRKLAVP